MSKEKEDGPEALINVEKAKGWKPSPIPPPSGLEKVGPFYSYKDAIRFISEAKFRGRLAHLKDRCDFTPNSHLRNCLQVKGKDGETWMHCDLSSIPVRELEPASCQFPA